MNSRAFFSVFVTLFAIIFLVSLYHTQNVRVDSQVREVELSIMHQQLSKDWFLVRNALTNFASDAMLRKIKMNPILIVDFDSCNAITQNSINAIDFAPDVNSYWNSVVAYTNAQFGTHCDVNLSGAVEYQLENLSGPPTPALEQLHSGERSYGLLTCSRTSANAALTVTRPFVIRKLVEKSYPVVGQCRISVYDILGTNDNVSLNYTHKKLDVNETFV